MDFLDLSSTVGLVALGLLTLNLLVGLLLAMKYNPVRRWPHRRIDTVRIHNWTGYAALAVALLHPFLILFDRTAGFGVVDLLYPVDAPKQPVVNTLGAIALYALIVVVVTSIYRFEIGRKPWKRIHFTAYAAAGLFFVHGFLADPLLKDRPVDPFDGEKAFIELCFVLVLAASLLRVRYAVRHPKKQHRPRVPRRPAVRA